MIAAKKKLTRTTRLSQDSNYKVVLQNTTGTEQVPDRFSLQRWVNATLVGQIKQAEIVIRVVSIDEITDLNSRYRNKNKPTNVLSFQADIPTHVDEDYLGDIVICADVIATEAKQQQKTLQAHWAHMVVHGCLHLVGFDHEIEPEAEQMESLETTLLTTLGFANPYESDSND